MTPLTFRSCQQVGRRELRVEMTGGRAERLHWNENGTGWTAWRQNVLRGWIVQRIQSRDAIQMPLFGFTMSQRVDHCLEVRWREGEGGVFFFCFFFQVVFFRLHRLRASILVRPAGLDRPSSSVSAPSLTLLLSNVCVWVTYLNLLSNSLSSENLCMHVGVFLSF